MTAIVQDRYGPTPEAVLRVAQVDRLSGEDGDVLVRVHAASVDRRTWHIEAVGDGVSGLAPGDEVSGIGESTYAGYAFARENAGGLTELRELIQAGAVTPAIDGTYPSTEVAAAIRHLLDGQARGKAVISVFPATPQTPSSRSTT